MIDREQLLAWLCGPDAPVPTPAEIASILGLSWDRVRDSTLLRVAGRLCAARFTLAVLRDVFVDDDEVREWLRAPRAELGGRCAVDLLMAGDVRPVEELAAREWHGTSLLRCRSTA
ncbi:MAG TPA: antitoxin Xre/MbcA/ParS toxin-binding domain-containing protein [Gemmatimonadaceae bacterium]|nr:antitoxin Xre/MbcA/ParS toxin-binding domain-containing protein [Gemmatimonadaceae bacterium]